MRSSEIILFAQGEVGSKVTSWLLEHYPNDIAVFVGNPDLIPLSIQQANRIQIIDSTNESEILSSLATTGREVNLGVLAWWPHVIGPELLSVPTLGYVNMHPSFLPYNRGVNPNFWAIVDGTPFGVTLHLASVELDGGPIIAQRSIDIEWTDTGESLYKKARSEIFNLFIEVYPGLRSPEFIQTTLPQQELSAIRHSGEMQRTSVLDLDSRSSVREVLNLLRARTFKGYPGCRFEDNDRHYEVAITITETDRCKTL